MNQHVLPSKREQAHSDKCLPLLAARKVRIGKFGGPDKLCGAVNELQTLLYAA